MSRNSAAAAEDADQFIDLNDLLVIARRRWKIVALCAMLGLVLGSLLLLVIPPVFTASTRILLDEDLARYADGSQPAPARIEADSRILSEVEILKSARLAQTVVSAENLAQNEAFLNPPLAPVAWLKAQIKAVIGLVGGEDPPISAEDANRGRAVALLQAGLNVERVGRSFVIELSYRSTDADLAGAITRAYARAYLADQLDANFDATQRATVWMQERLAHLRDSSQAAAMDVERYKAEHGLSTPRGELLSEQQLADLNSQLILARAETANALARHNQYKSIVDSGPENAVRNATIPPDQANSAVLTDLKTRYLNVTRREAEITSRFGEDHAQAVILRREQADLTNQIFQELQRLAESYRNEYEVAKARETSLASSLGELAGDNSAANQALVQLRELEQKAAALSTLYQTYLSRYEEASQQSSFPIAKARVISEASNPTIPSSPRKSMTLAFSLVLGMFAGAGVSAFQELRERFFRTAEDVHASTGANFLGYLPLVDRPANMTKRPSPRIGAEAPDENSEPLTPNILRLAFNAPASHFAETLRNTKLAADVVLRECPSKVIAFVSVLPQEGKTTVSANFAALLAASGARTLLIDGDLRNPGLSRALSRAPEKGLVDVLLGEEAWQNIVKIDRSTRLAIIPAAQRRRVSHTSELLSGASMHDLIAQARKSFRYIVVDLPPLAPIVDAKAFAPLADGFVAVAEWGVTPRALVRSSLQAEPQIASKVLGLILNKTDMNKLARYGASGGYEQYLDRYAAYYMDSTNLDGKR